MMVTWTVRNSVSLKLSNKMFKFHQINKGYSCLLANMDTGGKFEVRTLASKFEELLKVVTFKSRCTMLFEWQ